MTPYYQDDLVTIYHGDCREWMPKATHKDSQASEWCMNHEANAIVTDPPYGLGDLMERSDYAKWALLWGDGAPEWDRVAPDFLVGLVARYQQAIVWGGNYFAFPPARGWLIWDKMVREFSSGHAELAWTNLNQPIRAYSYSHGQLALEGKVHPTQKPLPLMRWCVAMTTGVVLDPFMGSGSTLVAAKSLDRKAIGIEIEERYCEVAANRCRQDTLSLFASG